MKTLSEYLVEQFTVGGTISDKIILFDVDDTLINTTAHIWVKKNGEYIKRLTNSEYNDYKLKSGEEFDYKEFDDLTLLNNESLKKYWYTLKREYKKGTHVGILTARSNVDMIQKFLLNKDVDIKKDLIFAIGDPKLGLVGSIQQRKSEVIDILYNKGYKRFIFFDDNINNLNSVKNVEKILPIKIHTIKA